MNNIKSISFFEAGNAIFTVSNPTGEHYTFKILHKKNNPFFVSLLTGPNNTSDFTYLGVYVPQNKTVVLTTKSKFKENTTPVKVIRWAIKKIASGDPVPKGYTILHEGKCCKCGRSLTTPESIENGIGPECMKNL